MTHIQGKREVKIVEIENIGIQIYFLKKINVWATQQKNQSEEVGERGDWPNESSEAQSGGDKHVFIVLEREERKWARSQFWRSNGQELSKTDERHKIQSKKESSSGNPQKFNT